MHKEYRVNEHEYMHDPEALAPGGIVYTASPVALFESMAASGQHAPGAKLDGGKPDASLLQFFARALLEVAWVGTYGQRKYTRGGWQDVPDGRTRYSAAMLRHYFDELVSGTFDTDEYMDRPDMAEFKGTIRHDAQVAWNALARLELALREEENA